MAALLSLLLAASPSLPARPPEPSTGPPLDPKVELAAARARIPFSQVDRRISVAATLNGQGPFHFILDTGASGQGRVDLDIARALGLQSVGRVIADDGTGLNAKVREEVRIDHMELPGAVFENLTFTASDYSWIHHGEERRVDGILGFGLFEELLLTIDYPEYTIELSRESLSARADNVTRYNPRHGICLAQAQLGEHEVEINIDTGSSAGLTLPEVYAERLKLRGKPRLTARGRRANNAFDVYSARLEDDLLLAGNRLRGLEAGFIDIAPRLNVGYGVLRDYVLSFDQRRRLVRIAPPAEKP